MRVWESWEVIEESVWRELEGKGNFRVWEWTVKLCWEKGRVSLKK